MDTRNGWVGSSAEPRSWRSRLGSTIVRIAAVGDSFTEGLGDEDENGNPVGWADRVALALARQLEEPVYYANFAIRGRLLERIAHEQIDAALSLEVAPDHYGADLATCLGLGAASNDGVDVAALRLGRELLAFLRERDPNVDSQPDVARYLADGTLERHLGFLD